MRLLADKSTLVVVGGFNPALLNPNWIGKHALGWKDDQKQVQVGIQIPAWHGSTDLSSPRFMLEGFAYSVTPQRLTFYFGDLDIASTAKVMHVVEQIFKLLSHTPVNGIGFNFGFESNKPSAKLDELLKPELSLIEAIDEDASIAVRLWGNAIRIGEILYTISCKQEADKFSVDINIHQNVNNTAAICALLADGDLFQKHLDKAKLLATTLNEGELE